MLTYINEIIFWFGRPDSYLPLASQLGEKVMEIMNLIYLKNFTLDA